MITKTNRISDLKFIRSRICFSAFLHLLPMNIRTEVNPSPRLRKLNIQYADFSVCLPPKSSSMNGWIETDGNLMEKQSQNLYHKHFESFCVSRDWFVSCVRNNFLSLYAASRHSSFFTLLFLWVDRKTLCFDCFTRMSWFWTRGSLFGAIFTILSTPFFNGVVLFLHTAFCPPQQLTIHRRKALFCRHSLIIDWMAAIKAWN